MEVEKGRNKMESLNEMQSWDKKNNTLKTKRRKIKKKKVWLRRETW